MEVMTPLVTGAMLVVFTLVLRSMGKGRFDELKLEMNQRFEAQDRQFEALRHEMRAGDAAIREEMRTWQTATQSEFGSIRSELVAIHTTLAQVALAVSPRQRPQTG